MVYKTYPLDLLDTLGHLRLHPLLGLLARLRHCGELLLRHALEALALAIELLVRGAQLRVALLERLLRLLELLAEFGKRALSLQLLLDHLVVQLHQRLCDKPETDVLKATSRRH